MVAFVADPGMSLEQRVAWAADMLAIIDDCDESIWFIASICE